MTTTDKLSPTSDYADFSIGSIVFDRFEILDEVAAGAQGRVYKAKDLMLNNTVALKVLLSTSGNDREIMRFQQEARMASKMKHQSIATIYDFGIYENTPFLSMEFVAGESLASILNREHTLPILDFLEIFLPVCDAIQHAHEAGIIHRDIKPGNIVVSKSEDGTTNAKVLDFGVAKTLDVMQETKGRLTPTGNIIGSPNYMSPEQSQGLPLTAKSDNYSLGCVMWIALSGDPPFVRDNVMETLHCHANEELPKFSTIVDDRIPLQLTEIIDRLLSKHPDERPDLKTTVIPLLVEHLNSCIADLQKAARANDGRNSDTTDSAPIDVSSKLSLILLLSMVAGGFLLFYSLVIFLIDHQAQVENTTSVAKTDHIGVMEGLFKVGTDEQADVINEKGIERWIEKVRQGKKHDLSLGFEYKKEYLLKCADLPALQKLDLTLASVYDDDLKHIARITNLTYLSLNRTQVKTLEGLEKLRKLTGLELKNTTQINNQSLKNIGKVKTLKFLNLTHANIDDEGIKFLTGLQKLEKLDLTGTNVNAKAALYITKLSNLHTLILNETIIPEEALRDILRMPSLHTIKLEKCKSIDKRHLKTLRMAFPTVAFNDQIPILKFLERQATKAAESNNQQAVYNFLHEAIRLLKNRFGSDSPEVADYSAKLSIHAAVLGKRSEALELIQTATRYAELKNDKSLMLATLNCRISVDEITNGANNLNPLAAEQRALKLEQAIYGPSSEEVLRRILRIADYYLGTTQYAKALQLVENNEAFQTALNSRSKLAFIGSNVKYAECLRYTKKTTAARARYTRAINILESIQPLTPWLFHNLLISYLGRCQTEYQLGKFAEALESNDKAIALVSSQNYTVGIEYKLGMHTQRMTMLELTGQKVAAAQARETVLKLKAERSAENSEAAKEAVKRIPTD